MKSPTAACVAAAASDVVDKDYANALGNFGLFAVLLRFYFVVPKIMAVAREGGMRWIKAEDNYLEENFPWYDWIGKIGWSCLVFSVGLQVIQVAGLLGI